MRKKVRKVWDQTETEILMMLYPRASWPEIQRALPRWNKRQIRTRAATMKLRREIGRRSGEFSWQPAEDALLDKHFCGTPLAKLKAMFPNRSVPAIFSRARVRGLKRWRDADEGPAISAAAHHQEMAAKYCGGVPTAETVDFAPYLKAIRDWAVNLALKANRQGSPLRRKDAKGENSSWRPGVLAVKSVKSEARP